MWYSLNAAKHPQSALAMGTGKLDQSSLCVIIPQPEQAGFASLGKTRLVRTLAQLRTDVIR